MRHLVGGTILFVALLGPVRVSGQSTGTGTIRGFVFDSSGAMMASVTVAAHHVLTGIVRQTLSTSEGIYALSALPVGQYEIRAAHPGFRDSVITGVVLDADTTVSLNITLPIGTTNENVQVSAAQIDTQTSDISHIVTGPQIRNVPLNGRNFTQLLTLGTGVVSSQAGRRMGLGQEGNPLLSINGGPISGTQFTYDGVLAMDTGGNRGLDLFPPPEAIEEIQIHTSNYGADIDSYGYGQVNVITKSGGTTYRGDVYDTLGNTALDARNLNTGQISPFREQAFGYTVGGPVISKRRQLFFFWSEAWNRRRGPQLDSFTTPPVSSFTATVMDSAMRRGDFSELLTQPSPISIVDPRTRQPFPDNRIPRDRLDPNAVLLLNTYFPLPNHGPSQYAFDTDSLTNWREELVRIDYQVHSNMLVVGRYTHDAYAQQQDVLKPSQIVLPSIGGTLAKPGLNSVVTLRQVLSPVTINEVTLGYSRNDLTIVPASNARRPDGITIPSVFGANVQNIVPNILIGNGYAPLQFQILNARNPIFTFREGVRHQVGRHAWSAGVAFVRPDKEFSYPVSNQQGTFNFSGGGTGYGPANFLLGLASSYTESTGQIAGSFRTSEVAEYVQDDWRLLPTLTVNLGLRVEQLPAQNIGTEAYGRISTFVPTLYDPAAVPLLTSNGQVVAGTGDPLNGIITPANQKSMNLPPSLLKPQDANWGPRVGVAWSPTGAMTPTLVIRAGYGIFYTWGTSNHAMLSGNPPFSKAVNIGATTLGNPGAGVSISAPPDLQAFDIKGFNPTVHQWSVSLEQQLPLKMMLTLAYVGNRATHVDQTININQPAAGSVSSDVNVNTVRPFRGYGAILYDVRNGSSRYNALQVHARRPLTNGQSIEMSYTWSRALQTLVGQDQFEQRQEQGPTDLDRPQVLTMNYFYALPLLRGRTDTLGRALGNWQVGAVITFQSGTPFMVTLTGDPAQVGVGNMTERPNMVAAVTYPKTVSQWFSTSSFAAPAAGTFGNEGLNALRGPGLEYWSMMVLKDVPFHLGAHGVQAQVAAEFHNVLNHTNPDAVDATFGSPTFGSIRTYLDPRNVDVRLRINF
jgi:hypothetical protein